MPDLHSLFPNVHFYAPHLTEIQSDVMIGDGSRVGSFTLIHAGARIGTAVTIGSHCNICQSRIGDRVSIQTGVHITRGVIIEDDVFIGPGVITLNDRLKGGGADSFPRIGHHAKIGGGSVILPGVTIGAYALIGAGSVVTKDVPDGHTLMGSPARLQLVNAAAGDH